MPKTYNIVLLGAGGVGKTSLLDQFISGCFRATHKPTVEDCHRHMLKMPDGLYHTVEILDTAGTHQFPAMRELAIRLGQAFIIVYSIDNRESFLIAKELMDSVHEIKGGSIAPLIMLIGNKSDTASDGLRQVETEEAEKATLGKNNCCFMETSAKKGRDVDTMFTSLLSKVLGVENSTNNFSKKKSRFMKRKHHSVNDMQPSTRQHGSVNRSQSWRDGTVRNMSDIDSPKCTLL